ncbi:hypothetical protein Taro_047428 [Colocasia esculenta]|uniref:Uncharacterized protein n=1 Tax=Colocasia esculenta TaxID=4460 RepID=A0A843X0U7_COLES|nr:hypothetical protein [Colocasia esculenta]
MGSTEIATGSCTGCYILAMELLRQDIELYAQVQREAHLRIKGEVLNLTNAAFLAGNRLASLAAMTTVMGKLDNLKDGQDLLLHQVEVYWEVMTKATRKLYFNQDGVL